MPLQLLKTALYQTAITRQHLESAIALVLINDSEKTRAYWWKLASELKEPLLTLSLMPEYACGSIETGVALKQLLRWQLQKLAIIIKSVDDVCRSDDTMSLSNALEFVVLPWLEKLHEMICLWEKTFSAGMGLAFVKKS